MGQAATYTPRRVPFRTNFRFRRPAMAHGITVGRVLGGAVALFGVLAMPTALSAQTTQTVTFTKDVAPIFQNKCESCHRPDSIAPMSLRTYEEARPWARSIR